MIHDAKVLMILALGVVALLLGGCRKEKPAAPKAVVAPSTAPASSPPPRFVPERLPMPSVPAAPPELPESKAAPAAKPEVIEAHVPASAPNREPLWRQRAKFY